MSNVEVPPIDVAAKWQAAFPPTHPDSAWLLRLMILRDDLEYELRNLWLSADAGTEDVWRCGYSLRCLSVSIFETRGILEHDVGAATNRSSDDAMRRLAPHLKDAIRTVREAAAVVEPIRNSIGAHLRPQNATPGAAPAAEIRVLQNHPNLDGSAHIDLSDFKKTTYRGFTQAAILFAWPTAVEDHELEQKNDELQQAIFQAVPALLHSIDVLLIRHWMNMGVLEAPTGFDFAVRDKKTNEYQRVRVGPPDRK